MKMNKIVGSLVAAGFLVSPMAYATNGDEMMAVGSQSTALGGTGVANYIGAESAFANPAMLGKSKGAEVTGGLVFFTPTVTNTGMPGGAAADSKASTSYIPDISFSNRLSDTLTYGVSMAGIAGMGVDYTGANASTHIKAKSAMSILRVVPTIAYNTADFGVGFSPVFQYGSLMLSYNNGGAVNAAESAETSTGFGYSLGGYVNVMPALILGASYQSEISAKYGTQISKAGNGFGLCQPAGGGCTGAAPFGDDLNQPAEARRSVHFGRQYYRDR
jgi:long-chain fatty acid transport protein